MSDAIKKLLHTMNRLYIVSAKGGDKRGDAGVPMNAVMSGRFSSLITHSSPRSSPFLHHPCHQHSPDPTPKGGAGVVLRMLMWSVMSCLIKKTSFLTFNTPIYNPIPELWGQGTETRPTSEGMLCTGPLMLYCLKISSYDIERFVPMSE